jgi:hypothetical protein
MNAIVPAAEADLVRRINEAHQQVQIAFVATGVAAINVGLLLLEAKRVVRHGSWAEWIGVHCHFSERTAQVYMQLAKRFPKPQISAETTITELMGMMGGMRLVELKDHGTKKDKKDHVAEAIKKGPLAILQQAWDAAQETEKKIFLSRIRPLTGAAEVPSSAKLNESEIVTYIGRKRDQEEHTKAELLRLSKKLEGEEGENRIADIDDDKLDAMVAPVQPSRSAPMQPVAKPASLSSPSAVCASSSKH